VLAFSIDLWYHTRMTAEELVNEFYSSCISGEDVVPFQYRIGYKEGIFNMQQRMTNVLGQDPDYILGYEDGCGDRELFVDKE
jgi:hypothetical protein